MQKETDTLPYHARYAKRYFEKGRGRQKIQSIVLHSTGGHREGDIATLTGETDRKVSVHWYVTKDGTVYHFVQDCDTAWHAGMVYEAKFGNACSIGIEHEHLDNEEPWPDVQIQTTAKLVAALMQKHGTLIVTSHSAIAKPKGRKVDPAQYPWERFHQLLAHYRETQWTLSEASS